MKSRLLPERIPIESPGPVLGRAGMKLPGARMVIVHENIGDLSIAVARRIAQIAAQAIGARGVFHIALAGGDTPRGCYRQLRNAAVDWEHVHIYFGDERCLPRGDVRRNDSMAHEELLAHVAIPRDHVHPVDAERGAKIAATEYAALLTRALPLDLVLLGLGEDGHTASLFPGSAATEQDDVVVPVFNAPKPPAERVSLSLGALNAAREKIFLVAGKEKREALSRIARGVALPAARVAGAEWHVDRAALPEET